MTSIGYRHHASATAVAPPTVDLQHPLTQVAFVDDGLWNSSYLGDLGDRPSSLA
jgi:hypothetical protein